MWWVVGGGWWVGSRVTEAAVRVDMSAEVEGHALPPPEAVPEARRVRFTTKVLQEFGYTDSRNQCDHIHAFNEHKARIAHASRFI